MNKYLTILEVSQKQAFIFGSNKLQDNIVNSEIIAIVLSPEYLEKQLAGAGYSDADNMVYSGGGHTILEFKTREKAIECTDIITEKIYREYDGLMVFARTVEYDETLSPKDNLKKLTAALEAKKSVRRASFHQGSYGIEKLDSNSRSIKCLKNGEYSVAVKGSVAHIDEMFIPEGFTPAKAFDELGGTKDDANFIAVVHIDGNGMGKRVEEFYDILGDADWIKTKTALRRFSESIDEDFKGAFKAMTDLVGENLANKDFCERLSLKRDYFPVRRVITAGDDICFVSEGRIGVECSAVFLEELAKQHKTIDLIRELGGNINDKDRLSACAGVAIVHQKYPFYRAYEIAEMLCSNAKKYGAKISPEDSGRSISAIDWHVEFGELADSIEEVRMAYKTGDGTQLEQRPYVVMASNEFMESRCIAQKKYVNFRNTMRNLMTKVIGYGTGKIKEMRGAMKEGEASLNYYLESNRMKDIRIEAYPELLFDAVELMDTYIEVGRTS